MDNLSYILIAVIFGALGLVIGSLLFKSLNSKKDSELNFLQISLQKLETEKQELQQTLESLKHQLNQINNQYYQASYNSEQKEAKILNLETSLNKQLSVSEELELKLNSERLSKLENLNKIEFLQQQYDTLLADKNTEIENLKNNYNKIIKETKESNQTTLQELKEQHEKNTKELEKAHQSRIEAMKQESTVRLSSIEEINKKSITILENELFNKITKLINQSSDASVSSLTKEITNLIDPFKNQLKDIQELNSKSAKDAIEQKGQLSESIKQLNNIVREQKENSDYLVQALRGKNKKALGNWGETQLITLLEVSGLQAGLHFSTQQSYKDAESKDKVPDCVIQLPNNRQVVIDSKVSIENYIRSQEASTEQEEAKFINQFIKDVKNHVDGLAKKSYHTIPELNTVDFVILYFPLDHLINLIYDKNNNILTEAYKNNIIIATNSTLLPILAMINNQWKDYNHSQEVKKMTKSANVFIKKIIAVTNHLITFTKSFNKANQNYHQLIGSFTNNQNIFKSSRSFLTSAEDHINKLINTDSSDIVEYSTEAIKTNLEQLVEQFNNSKVKELDSDTKLLIPSKKPTLTSTNPEVLDIDPLPEGAITKEMNADYKKVYQDILRKPEAERDLVDLEFMEDFEQGKYNINYDLEIPLIDAENDSSVLARKESLDSKEITYQGSKSNKEYNPIFAEHLKQVSLSTAGDSLEVDKQASGAEVEAEQVETVENSTADSDDVKKKEQIVDLDSETRKSLFNSFDLLFKDLE